MVSGGCFILEAVDSNWKVDVPMWGISIQSYTRRGDIQPFPGLWSWSLHWNGSRAYSYCGIDIGWQRFLVVADSSWAPPITSKNLAPADRALWRLGSTLLDKHDWIFIYLHPILCDYCWVEKDGVPIAGQQLWKRTMISCSSFLSSVRGCVLIPRSTAVRIRWCSIMGAATSGTGATVLLATFRIFRFRKLETSKRINTCAKMLNGNPYNTW